MTRIAASIVPAVALLTSLALGACDGNSHLINASPPGPALTVSPVSVTLTPGATQVFTAAAVGSISAAVTWSVVGLGTVDPVGPSSTTTYTAPGTTGGPYQVVATSVAAPAVSGHATVMVATASTDLGDVPAWVSSLPTLSNGMKWMPGVPGGIPAGTLDTTLTAGQVTAAGINSALSAASGRGSATNVRVVQLPAGTFAISGTITPRNFTILRGAGAWGAGRTRLNFNATGGFFNGYQGWPTSAVNVSGSLPVGTTQVTVASTATFAVDDIVQLDQLDDLSYVQIGDAAYHKRAPGWSDHGPVSSGGFRSVTSLHRVAAVNAGANTVTIDPPTRIAYDSTMSPQIWRVARRSAGDGLWWSGLESLSISGPTDSGAIVYNGGAYNWIKDVETDGNPASGNGGISNDHVRFQHQFRSEIRRLYSHHAANIGGGPAYGGDNYGVNLDVSSSENLYIDSIALFLNKGVQTNCAGAGNVFAYSYVDDTTADSLSTGGWMDGGLNGSHQSFTHHTLYEGNWANNIGCDTTHGNSGYMVWLRNYSAGQNSAPYSTTGNVRAFNVDGWFRRAVVIGNVLTAPTSGLTYQVNGGVYAGGNTIYRIGQFANGNADEHDTTGQPPLTNSADGRRPTFTTSAMSQLFRHGNWDLFNGNVVWDAAFTGHQIARSLFLPLQPSFMTTWPWVEPTGSTAAARVGTLPAKARYDAGTPFAVP